MKTIPASWKPSGTADRNLWYNNTGTMRFFVRIQKVNGDFVRIASITTQFKEEGNIARLYSSDYFESVGEIELGLNFLEGFPGAIGQMGQCELLISGGAINGVKFSELYDLDAFINATVDIYCMPQEAANSKPGLSIQNSLQQYKGVITNYKQTAEGIVITINGYSNTNHKTIPTRIDEFNAENSMNWNVPDSSKGKVLPVCFGFVPFFKAVLVSVSGTTPRYYWLAFHYPDQRTSTGQTVLYYYIAEKKHFKYVPGNQWTQSGYLSNSLYLISFNILDLAVYEELANYITPVEIIDAYPMYQRFLYPERFNDRKKLTTDDASLSHYWLFDVGTIYTVARAQFNKQQFNSRSNFDLYLCSEFAYPNSSAIAPLRWEAKHSFNINGTVYDILYDDVDTEWLWDSSNSRRYISTIPADFLTEGYSPTEVPRLIKADMSPEELTDIIFMFLSYKRTEGSGAPELYAFECCLKQVMLDLPREFYVRDDFGNQNIADAIAYLFEHFINISNDRISFENFEVDYKIDGQVHEEYESYDLFAEFANQFGIIFYEDDEGKERFIDLSPIMPQLTITDDDLPVSGSVPAISITRTDKEVFSSFYVDYCKNLATGEYEASAYVTPDHHNLMHIDANLMMQLCHTAQVTYNTDKRTTLKLDYVRDGVTAERLLAKMVQMYSSKKYIVEMQAGWRLMQLELGDQVLLNMTAFSSPKNFYVADIKKNPSSKTIDLKFFESPWDMSDLSDSTPQAVLSSTIDVSETIIYDLEDT